MDRDITLPGGAKTSKRAVLIVGGVAAAFVAYKYWTARSSSSTSVDDSGQLADAYALTGGTGADSSSGGGGSFVGYPTGYGAPSTGATSPTDNGTWTQNAVDYLSGLGWDPAAAASALGRYLAGQATAADQTIITTAWGALGAPPAGSYSLPAIQPSTGGTPSSTPTTPTAPTTPAAPDAHALAVQHDQHVATLEHKAHVGTATAAELAELKRLAPPIQKK